MDQPVVLVFGVNSVTRWPFAMPVWPVRTRAFLVSVAPFVDPPSVGLAVPTSLRIPCVVNTSVKIVVVVPRFVVWNVMSVARQLVWIHSVSSVVTID